MSAEETLETRQFDLDILHWLEVKKVCVNLCRQILEISDVLVNVFWKKLYPSCCLLELVLM
ncbi:MAG: hypothetical protein N5P05_004471 (plasmid) [Chroococcopsis gigantea SAG 12.99]|nr:hypothetical protein [Chroococcopsis gigantea SAG 12.99]